MLGTNCRPFGVKVGRLGDLPVGEIVKDGGTTCHGETILWKIADIGHPGYPDGSVTLISHRVITLKTPDAKEPDNTDAYARLRGNARYHLSNIRQWANSTAGAGEWYSPAHTYDAPPISANIYNKLLPYEHETGFLHNFSPEFLKALMPTYLTTIDVDVVGGFCGFTDRIFSASAAEAGLANYRNTDEGTKLALFSDAASRLANPTQACVQSSNEAGFLNADLNVGSPWYWWLRSPCGKNGYDMHHVGMAGEVDTDYSFLDLFGFRPLCNLPAATRVSVAAGEDGAYSLFV